MHRKTLTGVLSVAALSLSAAPAFAISDAQACEADGGTFEKSGGTATCVYPVGNSHNVKTTEQKGSFESSHDETKTNPGGNQPPGQQGGDSLR